LIAIQRGEAGAAAVMEVVVMVAMEGDIMEVTTEAMQGDIFQEVMARVFTQEKDVIYVIQE
jgi:hypothetical protein